MHLVVIRVLFGQMDEFFSAAERTRGELRKFPEKASIVRESEVRETLIRYLAMSDFPGRSDFKIANGAAYQWLWRYDKQWMDAQFENAGIRKKAKNRQGQFWMWITDLSDQQWQRLEPHIPCYYKRQNADYRGTINGILWHLATGRPWNKVPNRYGYWETCRDRFRRWSEDGTWQRLLKLLMT